MVITAAHITPIVAIVAGVLILIIPRLLNFIVAIYLIFIGLVELNETHHWVRFGAAAQATPVSVNSSRLQSIPWLNPNRTQVHRIGL